MKRRGISIIVLVISIIVIAILAAAIIFTLINSNTIDQSKKAKFMSDFTNIQEGVNLYSLSKYNAETNEFELPLRSYLTADEKTYISDNMPTLKTKIEELSGTLDTVNLAWISSEDVGVTLSRDKVEKGYIIDVDNGQIYDYNGDFFEEMRWHTLDGGTVGSDVIVPPEEVEEMWDGWIRLTLYYPSNSTERKWRLGAEGEIRSDPMLMWQNYVGPIKIPLDRTKDVWIKYKLDNKEVIVPPAGTLLVDIVPDKTGYTKVPGVKVHINFDETATVKEYRVGSSGWMPYTGEFDVTENCIIEARAKKTESIYNTDGSLLLTRDIAGSDRVYIGNIGIVETPLAAPTITRLSAESSDEVAKVQIAYPENATKKVYKINYGTEQNYSSQISVKDYGTYIIAYYYDASGKKSSSTAIYINDTSTGLPPDAPEPHEPYPPVGPGYPPIFDPKTQTNLPAPTITRVAGQNPDEKARIQVTYPANAAKKIYTIDFGAEQEYIQDIVIKEWGPFILAYYYDADGNKSQISYIRVNEVPTPPGIYDPPTSDNTIPAPPIINVSPSSGVVSEVSVSISSPADANKTYIKIGRYGEYQEYKSPIIVRDNVEVYAYYKTFTGKQSQEARKRIQNIRISGDPGGTSGTKPYVYIDAVVYPWSGTFGQTDVTVTVKYSDVDAIEYSEDGVIFTPYTQSFKVTQNKRIYARGTNANGVTETYLDITNIGKLTPPKVIGKLSVNINVNPEPSLSTTRVPKARVSIDYDSKATEKYYRIGARGELKPYTGAFDVTTNCTIYAYAKATDAVGQTSKVVDNLIDGISDPIIVANPTKPSQASKVTVQINYDKYATIKRYSIDGGALRDYTGEFEITKNGTKIYAYSQNVKGQSSNASYTIENIVPKPPVLALDKGDYYLIKLNYPEGSKGREYKWKADGSWGLYKEAGILLIKPQFKDKVIQNGLLVKIQDENGNLINFTGDYYLIDVPISEMFENIYMRWDRVTPGTPRVVLNTTEPAMQVNATIIYDQSLITKQYRLLKPDKELGEWLNYTGPITIDRNNTIIYSRGMDDAEVWSLEGVYKVTNIDENPPIIKLTADLETAMQRVGIRVSVTDDVAVGKVKWAAGVQGESHFTNSGTEILNNSLAYITSNGYYTFYAEDKVGNKQVYTLNITNVDLTAPDINIYVNPEDTVGLTTNITIDYGDSVLKQYKIGTASTVWNAYSAPFNLTSNTVLANNWQNTDGTVTIYAKGKDKAGNEVIVQKKVLSLDLDKPSVPIINSNSSYATLSEYGPKFDAETTITYDSRTDIDNFYSVDNGATWIPYIGKFDMLNGTVIAKSVKKVSGLETVVSKTVTMPADALKAYAYDGNDSTFIGEINQYMLVDSSMQGKRIRVKWYSVNSNYVLYIKFLDENKQQINYVSRSDGTFDDIYTIPANTRWILYTCPYNNASYEKLYEIQPSNEPTFTATNGYMTLTADPTKSIKEPYQMVNPAYFQTSVQRLYRIGTTGNWLSYNDQPIWVKQGQTIYAKGIDVNGNQTRVISSYTANVPDAMKKEVYDGNDSTFTGEINQYMSVDSSMQGKRIRVRWYSVNSNYVLYLKFLNESKQQISAVTRSDGTYDDIYTIPANTRWILYTCTYDNASYEKLFEIQPSNEPTFSAINGYMTLTADPTKAIKEPYQMVTPSYFPTSVQRLYRIGTTGDWLNYEDKAIWVKQGQTLYTKGIDIYGNETRVTSSYTANVPDALKKEAYDGNDSTYIGDINQYMLVDSTMQGKAIRVRWYSVNSNYVLSLKFLNESKQQISTVSRSDGTYDDIYTIPANTKWIVYTCSNNNSSYEKLFEIQPSNEPTFSAINGYMTLTADPTKAIKEPYQMVSVSYFPTSVQRLYRIGTTGNWLNYEDKPIWVKQDQTLYTKGIDIYGNETRIVSSYTANVPDALKKEAYDGNDGTYIGDINQYMLVDSTMQGKRIRVRWYSVNSSYVLTLKFLDANKQQISIVTRSDGTFDDIYTIPANTKWIVYTCPYNNASYEKLYEIQVSNEPTFSATNGYMLLTANSIDAIKEPYQMVTVSYFPTSVQRLYRIGTTDPWQDYEDTAIWVKQGQTLYTKGIDVYGNETRITSSYTSNVPDALKKEAYDGNYSTYIGDINQYMLVDSGMQGKKIRVRWYSVNSNYVLTLKFLNESKQQISVITRSDGTFDEIYTIPANTKWILYTCPYNNASYEKLYEIQPSN